VNTNIFFVKILGTYKFEFCKLVSWEHVKCGSLDIFTKDRSLEDALSANQPVSRMHGDLGLPPARCLSKRCLRARVQTTSNIPRNKIKNCEQQWLARETGSPRPSGSPSLAGSGDFLCGHRLRHTFVACNYFTVLKFLGPII
jgi:hypothetical protein